MSSKTNLWGPTLLLLTAAAASCAIDVDTLFEGIGGAGGDRASSGSVGGSIPVGSAAIGSSRASSSASGQPVCGNFTCDDGETLTSCPVDCTGVGPSSSVGSGGSGGGSGTGGAAPCTHPLCSQGGPLEAACDPCVAAVCSLDDVCCDSTWDETCVEEAMENCGIECCGDGSCSVGENCDSCPDDCGPCGETCSHPVCKTGGSLDVTACTDPCVATVCGALPSCCSAAWTSECVDEAVLSCGTSCTCAHGLCKEGELLVSSCDPCVTIVCEDDEFCCGTEWDSVCVDSVFTLCGIACN